MPKPPQRPQALLTHAFGVTDARTAGLSYRQLRRHRTRRRLLRGTYVEAALADPRHPGRYLRQIEAAALVIPDAAMVTGLSAAYLHGVELLGPTEPVRVVVPRARRFGHVKGLRIRQAEISPSDVVDGPVRHATPLRTAWDCARYEDIVEAVAAIDALARQRLLDLDELRARARQPGRRGRKRVEKVLDLVDPRAESPQESRLRVRLVLAGLPAPEPQHLLFSASEFVARLDLAWPAAMLAVEYDGYWHAEPEQFQRDRRRLHAIIRAGWHVVGVTADRMRKPSFTALTHEIASLLAERTPAPPSSTSERRGK